MNPAKLSFFSGLTLLVGGIACGVVSGLFPPLAPMLAPACVSAVVAGVGVLAAAKSGPSK